MARKPPTPATIKKLFALSGNTCAFQACNNKLVENDTVIGEVCHIEAANKGARYNPDTGDEDLRNFDNLILMCKKCHKIIDDNETKYTTALLKDWKKEHEEKYSNIDFLISDSNVEKVINEIQNQYIINQKAEKININVLVNYNEADQTDKVEKPQEKDTVFDDIPEIKFDSKLPKPKKPSKIFTGRKDKLSDIENAFNQSEIITITGIGGIGKTELILKFIDSFKDKQKEKINWLDFTESTNFDNFIVASGFEVIIPSNKTEIEKFSAFKDKVNEHERIIIWDNFHDNTDDTFNRFLEFSERRLNKSNILIISRTNEKTSRYKNIELTDFKESFEFAKALINERYKQSELTDEEIKDICNYTKGHPLAIELTLNLCKSMSINKVLGKLSQHKKGIDELSHRLFEDILEQGSTSREEKEFLYQFSIFKERVSEEAVEVIFGEACFQTLPSLRDKYLIEFEQKHYDTHPLIREFCYRKLENKKDLHNRAATYFISKRTEKLDTLREERIFHHLKGAENYIELEQTIEKYGRDYIRQAFYKLLQEMIAIANKKDIETPLYNILLGDIYETKGEWDNALKYFEKAKDNQTVEELAVEGLLKSGNIYRKKGIIEKAFKLFKDAEEISKVKGFQKYIAWSYNNIAIIKQKKRKINEALKLFQNALTISKNLNIEEDIATLYNNIGYIILILNIKNIAKH